MLELNFTNIVIANVIKLKEDFMERTRREPRYLYVGEAERQALIEAVDESSSAQERMSVGIEERTSNCIPGLTLITVDRVSFLKVGD